MLLIRLHLVAIKIMRYNYNRYDRQSGQSRIDYYGGMVKTYQLKNFGQYGTSLKIAPVTTEDILNVNECLQVNGTEEMSIEVQSILPELTGFECIGNLRSYFSMSACFKSCTTC